MRIAFGQFDGLTPAGAYHAHNVEPDAFAYLRQGKCGRGVTCNDQHLDAAARQKLRIFDRVAFDSGQRFCAVRHTGGVAQINEMLVGQAVVKRPVDG